MFCCVFPEPGELGPRKPQGPDEHAQLLTVRVKPISLTWANWKERAGCQPQVTAQQAVPRDTCVPWRSQAITFSASPASSQGSAEPQVHGFGCLTPAWAGQEGKGEIAGKITIIHSPKTTLVSSVLFCSTVLIWVKVSEVPQVSRVPYAYHLSKELPHCILHFLTKTKSSLNTGAQGPKNTSVCPGKSVGRRA